MEDVYRSFCAFGAEKGGAAPLMEGAKFAKLCRDLNLLDRSVTPTDVDIIFSKVKPKTERKINFSQFNEALRQLAEKKFPGDPDALEKMQEMVIQGKGPIAHGVTKAVKSAAVERLTDASKYTGSHRERFDEGGRGKGILGRKEIVDTSGYVTGYKDKGNY